MAAEPTTTPRRVLPTLPPGIRRPVVGSAVTLSGPAAAVVALGGCVAVSLWVVPAGAGGRSYLSPPARREVRPPPARRECAPGLVGPLGRRLPSLTPSTVTLGTELDVALGLLAVC